MQETITSSLECLQLFHKWSSELWNPYFSVSCSTNICRDAWTKQTSKCLNIISPTDPCATPIATNAIILEDDVAHESCYSVNLVFVKHCALFVHLWRLRKNGFIYSARIIWYMCLICSLRSFQTVRFYEAKVSVSVFLSPRLKSLVQAFGERVEKIFIINGIATGL